jgi:hypothetical protein
LGELSWRYSIVLRMAGKLKLVHIHKREQAIRQLTSAEMSLKCTARSTARSMRSGFNH